jgi:hypothetical protein
MAGDKALFVGERVKQFQGFELAAVEFVEHVFGKIGAGSFNGPIMEWSICLGKRIDIF